MTTKKALDFELTLTKPIAVSGGECQKLTAYAPSNIHRPLVSKLQGMIGKAQAGAVSTFSKLNNLPQLQKMGEAENTEDENPLELIRMSCDQDDDFYQRFEKAFVELLTAPGICKLDVESCELRQGYYEAMDYKDFDNLMERYLSFFIEK